MKMKIYIDNEKYNAWKPDRQLSPTMRQSRRLTRQKSFNELLKTMKQENLFKEPL